MREILFRGKRLDGGEWIEGDGIHYPKSINYKGTCWIDGGHEKANDWVRVDPSTVGQYTGLTDKNGVKIFEGDIVDGCDFSAEDGYGVIQWEDGAFEAVGHDLVGTFHENYWGYKDFEVIGNIHDNPELIEG